MSVVSEAKNIDTLKNKVKEQGGFVKKLKENGALVNELRQLPKCPKFDRSRLEDLLKQKFFYDHSFAIYGGVQGLYDYGPMGCAMKANLLSAWRQFFVLEDHLLEVDCSILTPEPVLQASGHVDRFTDFMVKDSKTGECFRADHLIKAALESKQKNRKISGIEKQEIEDILLQLDNYDDKGLYQLIQCYEIKSPTNNELTKPQPFNLMFSTLIGPTGQFKGYLRPETAQGIFVNFQRLLQFNQGRLPFGAAQIGSAFRNEISPRSGLIRVREFTMAEIEYFVDPADKNHPKFENVRDLEVVIYSSDDQMNGTPARTMTIKETVEKGIVANQTLAYFLARIHLFLVHVGVDPKRLRFRQHLANEMAHYACDCWDAECQTSYGWIECVGCADRSCYDLTQHTRATGTRLVAEKPLSEPRTVRVCECVPNKAALGKVYRSETKTICERLNALSMDEAFQLKKKIESDGKTSLRINEDREVELDQSMVHVKSYENVVHVEEIVPNVIEPSFGIGRILYTVFEHSFRVREGDEQRTYLALNPVLAPYKCSLLPLSNQPEFAPFIRMLSANLTKHGVSHRIDEGSGSIGRRYARTDQIAIPYGITIDFDTINCCPSSATLRERDSMKQIRVPLNELPALVSDLANNVICWDDARAKYPAFEQQETVLSQHQRCKELPSKSSDKVDDVAQETRSSSLEDFYDETPLPKQPLCGKPTNTEPTEKTVGLDDLVDRIDNIDLHNVPSEFPKGSDARTSLNEHVESDDTKLLSWAGWGKAIRKGYKEQEAREKLLAQQKPHGGHVSAASDHAPDQDEARSNNSGYEADQEDNGGTKCYADKQAPISEPPSESVSTNEYISIPHIPDSETHPNVKTNAPHHGLFVGDGWPGQNKTVSTLHSSLKFERNATPAKKITLEYGALPSTINDESIENKYSRFLKEDLTLEDEIKRSFAETQVSLSEPVGKMSGEKMTDLGTKYHGLFAGPGWPAPKSTDKISTSKANNLELDKQLHCAAQDLSLPASVMAPESDLNSVIASTVDNIFCSEQWQLSNAKLGQSFTFKQPNHFNLSGDINLSTSDLVLTKPATADFSKMDNSIPENKDFEGYEAEVNDGFLPNVTLDDFNDVPIASAVNQCAVPNEKAHNKPTVIPTLEEADLQKLLSPNVMLDVNLDTREDFKEEFLPDSKMHMFKESPKYKDVFAMDDRITFSELLEPPKPFNEDQLTLNEHSNDISDPTNRKEIEAAVEANTYTSKITSKQQEQKDNNVPSAKSPEPMIGSENVHQPKPVMSTTKSKKNKHKRRSKRNKV